MIKLLTLMTASMVLAYISDRNTKAVRAAGRCYSVWGDWAYILLVVLLTLFAGLRTRYNDTRNYIQAFGLAPTLSQFLSDPENLNPFKNPLFYLFQSAIKTWTGNSQVMIFVAAVITQTCFVRFFKRYSENFFFSIFLYFTLGTYVFTLAAIKQVLGMAVVTLAFSYIEKKKWGQYYALILIAMLIHTYAIAFALLPLFTARPWKMFTFVFIAVMATVMMNFESAITAFMEQANDLGKTLADYELFDDHTINIFRLSVYAVPPLFSLIFQKWILQDSTKRQNVLVHMSIISLAFMSMGTQSGANMFGRMGNYFELGTICGLPWMLKKTFEDESYRLISIFAGVCFLGFFAYANMINLDFGQQYQAISLWQFIRSLF